MMSELPENESPCPNGAAGDLGNAAKVFEAAVALWQGLLKSRPENEEYQEGLSWSRQRLEDLK